MTISLYLTAIFSSEKCSEKNFVPLYQASRSVFRSKSLNQTVSQQSFEILSRLMKEVKCPTEINVKI